MQQLATPTGQHEQAGARRYHISLIAPDGFIHSAAFTELAEMLAQGLLQLGMTVTADINLIDPAARNIVLGAHLLDAASLMKLPASTIIYNTEPLGLHGAKGLDKLPLAANRLEIWDYSLRNLAIWRSLGVSRQIHYLPPGYTRSLTRIEAAVEQDIDILFYGSLNPRRYRVLDALTQRGVKLGHLFGVYGKERDAAIARAKLVLNLHFYEAGIFESVRVSYLLANSKAVVAEVNPDTEIEPWYLDAVQASPYESLVESCMRLLADAPARQALEQSGFTLMQQHHIASLLRPMVCTEAELASATT